MRPIDADALKDELCAYCEAVEPRMRDCLRNCINLRIIDEMQILDVVPVVRCKDCLFSEKRRYLGDDVLYCTQFDDFMEESDFCCRAKRKDG